MTERTNAVGDARVQHALDGHQLLIADDDAHWAGIGEWLRRGAARDECLIYAADPDTSTVGDLQRALVRHRADLAEDVVRAVADGRLTVSEPERYFSVQGHRALVEDGLGAGRRVRTCHRAEPVARMPAGGQAAFEHLLDELWETREVSTLCVHGADLTTAAERLDGAVRLHDSGWGDRHLHAHTPAPGQLVLAGEVDMSNVALLTAVVDEAARRSDGELTVDCSALTHVSVGGWRALHVATADLRERDVPVRLLRVRPLAAKILQLTGLGSGMQVQVAPETGP